MACAALRVCRENERLHELGVDWFLKDKFTSVNSFRFRFSLTRLLFIRSRASQVIFTTNKDQKFADVDLSQFQLVNKAHNIYFEDEKAERAYASLLEFRCKVCKMDFPAWKELDAHLRREHELFVCDLCADTLKIFSHERKYYTRKDLARHRKVGDPDDTR